MFTMPSLPPTNWVQNGDEYYESVRTEYVIRQDQTAQFSTATPSHLGDNVIYQSRTAQLVIIAAKQALVADSMRFIRQVAEKLHYDAKAEQLVDKLVAEKRGIPKTKPLSRKI